VSAQSFLRLSDIVLFRQCHSLRPLDCRKLPEVRWLSYFKWLRIRAELSLYVRLNPAGSEAVHTVAEMLGFGFAEVTDATEKVVEGIPVIAG